MTDGGLAWEFEVETLEEIGTVLVKPCKNLIPKEKIKNCFDEVIYKKITHQLVLSNKIQFMIIV
jgi:hypothetical protein